MATIPERLASLEAQMETLTGAVGKLVESMARVEKRLTVMEVRIDRALCPGDAPACIEHKGRIRAIEEGQQSMAEQAADFSTKLTELDRLIERARGAWWAVGLIGGAIGSFAAAVVLALISWALGLIK